MTRAFARSGRIGQVERLLLTSRVPLSQAEIARRCEVHRSTIGRLVQDMVDEGIPIRSTDDGLLYIERTAYISKIHLKLHEALAVFLACRLLARYSDKPNAHTVTALEKLGASLQAVMPGLGQHIASTSQALKERLPRQVGEHQRTLERLTEAWAQGVKVRLWYRPLRAGRAFQHTFAPYFLEPSAIGFSTYALGVAEPPGKIRTRKLERIERIELTDEPFEVPAGFNPNVLLGGAWGIWFDEEDRPTTVRLRFSGEQAIRRMGETSWHPSQRAELDADGRLLWTAEIDEPQEMLPWVRGWGAACEILAPQELREQALRDIRRQMRVYGIGQDARPDGGLVAHTPPPGGDEWHMLVDHLTRVAELARGFAEPFGAGALAHQLGLWHDVGKASPDFQEYLRRCHANPGHKGRGPDHKAAGAILAQRTLAPLALLVQGHHGGLCTPTNCRDWLKKRCTSDVEPDGKTPIAESSIVRARTLLPETDPATPLLLPPFVNNKRAMEFFLRMLFSTLVDADYLDTEQHMRRGRADLRHSEVKITEALARFEAYQQRLMSTRRESVINDARDAMYQACVTAADMPPGLFRLAMPTGGGKTRSGMGFALRHAARYSMSRVIVAVPFISITEQTADEYRRIFEAEKSNPVVLEHHSGGSGQSEDGEYTAKERWKRLASENWDAPIVVTTTVQLFESMFANRTGRCRKLHRLAGSVIILDEAQALPADMLVPILDGLKQLCAHYGTTVVLSTATQPAFEQIKVFADLPARDIVPDARRWFAALKRVTYDWRLDRPLSWVEVADIMRSENSVLAVVNTKKDALALLDALNDKEVLHLSTLLCGAHRRTVIAEVKNRLTAGRPCRLVSTQVIEAGVDLDFPMVLRALGPLDRVIQAAGRCNREGTLAHGQVIVFKPAEGSLPPEEYYRTATQSTEEVIGRGDFDPENPADVHRYFERVFSRIETDAKGIQRRRADFDYPEVAAKFRMIDEETEDVIITTYGDSAAQSQVGADIELLRSASVQAREVLRRLQPYIVSIPKRDAERYKRAGFIEELPLDGIGVWLGKYDAEVRGLIPDDDRLRMSV